MGSLEGILDQLVDGVPKSLAPFASQKDLMLSSYIDEEEIFKAFRQSDETYARKYGVTGQGLAISKQLVSMMGGRIAVESEPGNGTRCTFTTLLGAPREE